MGSTWHTKCMFDLDSDQPSFCDLLVDQGIETYAMDIVGSGPGSKPITLGDGYRQTLDALQALVTEHKITHVMSYLNGSTLAVDLAETNSFQSLIFLDPVGQIGLKRKLVNNDYYVIDKKDIEQALIDNNTSIEPEIKNAYLKAVSQDNKLKTAAWPILNTKIQNFYNQDYVNAICSRHVIKAHFTRQANATVKQLFSKDCEQWNNSSWILLEPERVQLAESVASFIKRPAHAQANTA